MSGLKNFAIVGAGILGAFVVEEFIKQKAAGVVDKVVLLTRHESQKANSEKYAAKGVEVVGVDYKDKASLKQALTNVDAIISTIGMAALADQVIIAEAGKEQGAKLLVPSEFGNTTEGATGFLAAKGDLHAKFKAIGIPSLLVFTGPFADYSWTAFTHLDLASGKVRVGGDGNAKISFTSRPDIARFLGHALTTFPADKLENKILRLEGDRKSFNEVFKAYEAKTGKKLEVEYRPIPELEAAIKANAWDIDAALHLEWAKGDGVVGTPDNALYPTWNPTPVIDYL